MRWEQGRLNTGYEKLKLFQFWRFDCYVLRFRTGALVPMHTDVVPNKKHHRINILLKDCDEGGYVWGCSQKTWQVGYNRRFVYFRPDLIVHGMYEVLKGTKYILSIGWTT